MLYKVVFGYDAESVNVTVYVLARTVRDAMILARKEKKELLDGKDTVVLVELLSREVV